MEKDDVIENRGSGLISGNGHKNRHSGSTKAAHNSGDESVPLKARYNEPITNFDDENLEDIEESKGDWLQDCAGKCHLTPKRGLVYLIICGVVIIILLLIVILLLLRWPKAPLTNVCQSSECHSITAKILCGFNDSYHPCDDFWEFSCGGWLRSHPIPSTQGLWSAQTAHIHRVKEKIRTLINTEGIRDETNSVDSKIKLFYESCMGLEYIESAKDWELKNLISDLGGWEVLRTFRPNDFNFRRILIPLQGKHRVSPYFSIKIVSDPRTPSRGIIMISPAGLSLPDRSYYFLFKDPVANAFRFYAKDVVQLLGATGDSAVKFAEDLFEYEKRIARITPDSSNLTDPVLNYHILSVSQLKSKSTTIFWDDLLKSLYPQGQVNDLTEVLLPSIQYIEEISNIISATDPIIINNYLMWHLTSKYLNYLHRPFAHLNLIYRQSIIGAPNAIPRWEFCIDQIIEYLPHAINGLLAIHTSNRDNKREKIDSIFRSIKMSIRNRIYESSGIPDTWINYAVDKLVLMDIQIGTPIQNNSVLVDYYLSIVSQRISFFTNVQSALFFQHKQDQVDLASMSRDTPVLWSLQNFPFSISYIPARNLIVVPESLLQHPDLDYGTNQLSLVYGSIGVQLGEAIVRTFGPEQGLYLANGVLMPDHDPKVEETRAMIESKRRCLSSYFTSIRLDDEPYIERTSLDTLLHLGGIQTAYDAYQSLAQTPQILPSLTQYSSNALFFFAYAQAQCSASTISFHALEHSTFKSLSHDHRTKGLLRQLVGFTEALSCSRTSEMYSDFSCGYFL